MYKLVRDLAGLTGKENSMTSLWRGELTLYVAELQACTGVELVQRA